MAVVLWFELPVLAEMEKRGKERVGEFSCVLTVFWLQNESLQNTFVCMVWLECEGRNPNLHGSQLVPLAGFHHCFWHD